MKIKILNYNHPMNNPSGVDVLKTWISPDKKFAVAEVFRGGCYVAGKVIESDSSLGTMTIDSVDDFSVSSDVYFFAGHDVEWSYMCYGFCKLICWNIETNKYRTYRIYFDSELYKQKFEELNGTPYTGQKKFTHRSI